MGLENTKAQDVPRKGKFDHLRWTAVARSVNRSAARLYEEEVGFHFASTEENFGAAKMAKGEPFGD